MKVNTPMKKLLSVDEVRLLTIQEIEQYYQDHHNPGLTDVLRTLNFNNVKLTSAQGMYYYSSDGRKILDLWGGYGSLNLGHNHPRIIAAQQAFLERRDVEINMAFYSPYVAGLAKNISRILPGDLDYVVFGNSGAEAVEGALKLAEKYHGKSRSQLIYFSNSFHGKTHAALSVTSHLHPKQFYKLLPDCQEIPFGDSAALESALGEKGRTQCGVAAVIVEPIQGNGGVVPAPPGFLAKVRELCDYYGALMIVDEVASGFGRTGRMFAFEHDEILPDIVTMAKSLGGGKAAIGAFAARQGIFKKAYGKASDSSLLSTTFAGMGTACVIAIEALNIIYEENLIDQARENGDYFLSGLFKLQSRYPRIIKDVRGRGLMIGLEFHDFGKILLPILDPLFKVLGPALNGAYAVLVAVELLFEHDILVALTQARPNVLRLLPPLIISQAQIDEVLHALDEILSQGALKLGLKAVKRKVLR
jgi:acetylornithine/succinyldiaminopimelate/putrescine aminotransferase